MKTSLYLMMALFLAFGTCANAAFKPTVPTAKLTMTVGTTPTANPDEVLATASIWNVTNVNAANVTLSADFERRTNRLNMTVANIGIVQASGSTASLTGYTYIAGSSKLQYGAYRNSLPDLIGKTTALGTIAANSGIYVYLTYAKQYPLPTIAIRGDVTGTSASAVFNVCLTNPNPGTVSKNVKANIFINPNRKLEVFAETTVGTNITSWLYLDIPAGMKIGTVNLCWWDASNNWYSVPLDPTLAQNVRSINIGDLLAQDACSQHQRYLMGTLVPKQHRNNMRNTPSLMTRGVLF